VEQAVALALRHNLDVALSQAELGGARADVLEASAAARLKLSLGTYVSTQNVPMIYSGAPPVDPSFLTQLPSPGALDVNAMAMLPLFNGGRLKARLQAARAAERAALATVAARVRAAALAGRSGYYEALYDGVRLETAAWELQQWQEAARLARAQLKAGRVARYVVLRAEAEEARAEEDRNEAGARLVATRARLKTVLGIAQDSKLDLVDPFAEPPAAPPEDEALRQALAERPDLLAARAAVEEQDRRIAEASGLYSPQAWLVGMYEGMKVDPFRATPFDNGYSFGLTVAIPVVDGGERRAQVLRARAGKQGREAELARMEQEAAEQVIVARAELEAGRRNMELSRTELARADEDLRIARLRFQAGRSIYLEVLDALAANARARVNVARAGRDAGRAWAEFLYAIGRVS